MYSWSDDASPAGTGDSDKGYDYASARKAYDSTPPASARSSSGSSSSSYSDPYDSTPVSSRRSSRSHKGTPGTTPPPVGKTLSTDSTHPIVVCMDITGSMTDKPGIILEKLPLLGEEVKRWAPDYAISFACFGDAGCDNEPIQVRDFAAGKDLDDHLNKFYLEGNGGDTPESPDLLAYYYTKHCSIDKAIKPIFIFITDAPAHANLSRHALGRFIGDHESSDLDAADVLKELGNKFSTYVISAGGGFADYWTEIYGEQKVKEMEDARDIIEFILGIIASELGEADDFVETSSKRHTDKPERVSRVMSSLKLDTSTPPEGAEKATMSGSKKSAMGSKKKSVKLDESGVDSPMKSKKLA